MMNEALLISLVGVSIVFSALIIISITIAIVGNSFAKKQAKKVATTGVTPESTPQPEDSGELTPELIAVITAAVRTAYGPCTRIKSIGTLHKESQYGMQGRMKIMSSHKLK